MLAAARQATIVAQAREKGTVRVAELAPTLGVSYMTVRRDIDVLVNDGLLNRVHGGASLTGARSTDEPGFESKRTKQGAEKEAIAREAVNLILPGSVIGLGAGTTTWRLAALLHTIPDLTIVTNSVKIASVFYPRGPMTGGPAHVILTGGERTPSDALVGPVAVSAMRLLHLDTLFLGVHGMGERFGFTTPNTLEAETNREFMLAARKLVIVADHTKWGLTGVSTMANLDEASTVISDDGLPERARTVLAEHVQDLRLAPAHVTAS